MTKLQKISQYLTEQIPQLFIADNKDKFAVIGANSANVVNTTESLFEAFKKINKPQTDQEFPTGISYILGQNEDANFNIAVQKILAANCRIIIFTDSAVKADNKLELEKLFPETLFIAAGNDLFEDKINLEKNNSNKSAKKGPIGILGGMGPFATLFSLKNYFFPEKNNTNSQLLKSLGVVVSFGCDTPDRTKYLLDPKNNIDPTVFIQRDAAILHQIFKCSIKTITCNTAHAFLPALSLQEKYGVIIDMIKETALACKAAKRVFLTATAGTIETGLYQKYFLDSVKLLVTNEEQTNAMMEVIYGKNGVKTGDLGVENQKKYAQIIEEFSDIDMVIGGCTELPLVNQKVKTTFIDPMKVAYDSCVREIKKGARVALLHG